MTEQVAQEGQSPTTTPVSSTETGQQQQQTDWASTLSPEYQDLVRAKAWKSPEDALYSYKNMESYVGRVKSDAIVLPSSDDDADAWGKVYQKLGRPEAPNGYEFEGVDLNDPDQKSAAEFVGKVAFEQGLSKKQAANFVKKMDEFFEQNETAGKAQLEQFAVQNTSALKQELGAAFDEHMRHAEAAAKSVGMSADDMAALRSATIYAPLMKALAKIGAGMQEDGYVSSGGVGGSGALTPKQAQMELDNIKADPDYLNPNSVRHKSLREKAKTLYGYMYPNAVD